MISTGNHLGIVLGGGRRLGVGQEEGIGGKDIGV